MKKLKRSTTPPTATLTLLLAAVQAGVPGCGINPDMSAEQQERDAATKMAWIDKAVDIAERHNLAYQIEIHSSGRPSIGESIDFYLDTGLSANVVMFGNGAARRQPDEIGGTGE